MSNKTWSDKLGNALSFIFVHGLSLGITLFLFIIVVIVAFIVGNFVDSKLPF